MTPIAIVVGTMAQQKRIVWKPVVIVPMRRQHVCHTAVGGL